MCIPSFVFLPPSVASSAYLSCSPAPTIRSSLHVVALSTHSYSPSPSNSPTPSALFHRISRIQQSRPRARWHGKLPTHHDRAPWEPSESSDLAWKDRVALYAQFSPSATLDALLDALRAGARDDGGIEALYAFANVDVWQVAHRFFGRAMDLGQFERFKHVIIAPPYNVLLRHEDRVTLAALTLDGGHFIARVRFHAPRREPVVLTFRLTRGPLGEHTSWMVDSILHERGSSAGPAARSDPRPHSAR